MVFLGQLGFYYIIILKGLQKLIESNKDELN